MKRLLFLALVVAIACAKALAGGDSAVVHPVLSAYMLEAGSSHLADTYLTPLHYRGAHLGFAYERTQAMKFNPKDWIMQLSVGIGGNIDQNPAKNAKMVSLDVSARWGMMRRWALPWGITAGIGPAIAVNGGCLYLNRNGNNPASAKAAANVGALGYASWSRTVWKVPVTLRYQAYLPALGCFFSPDYGELYYQIYMGDRSGLAHASWWGNYFRLDNLLTADLHFGSTTLRLGYRCDIFTSKVNHLVTRDISHSFVLGVATEWLSLPYKARKGKGARKFSTSY
ncbi:MAG: DUF3316 domain-containing protein [Clostridium sp.]|nr:DUF3316 domain-containing protein [Clostridium sp.]